MNRLSIHPRRLPNRRGASAVEFAFCAPVFFVILFGGIEFARVNLVVQTVESACLQGGRLGIVPGASAESVEALSSQILDSVRINNYQVVVTPTTITPTTKTVSVAVSVPLSNNGYITPRLFGGKVLQRTMTFNRE